MAAKPVHATPGDLDAAFNGGGTVITPFTQNGNGFTYSGAHGYAVAVQPDGKIVAGGYAYTGTGVDDFALVRYDTNGALDSSFNGTGKVTTNFNPVDYSYEQAWNMALQSDGKIVLAGYTVLPGNNNSVFALARYNAGGTPDTTFNGTGRVTTPIGAGGHDIPTGIAIQHDGKLVVCGISWTTGSGNSVFAVARYNPNGTLDGTFNGTGIVTTAIGTSASGDDANAVALQADGKIIIAGTTWHVASAAKQIAVVRYQADGSLDASFNATGQVTTAISGSYHTEGRGVAVQADGKILVAGAGIANNGDSKVALVRYAANGALDTSFNGTGSVITALGSTVSGRSVVVQGNGKIVVVGNTTTNGSDFALVRYTSGGALDTSFHGTGKVTTDLGTDDGAAGVALQSDGKIVAVGQSGYQGIRGPQFGFALARYDGGSPGDADGDGLPDTWELASWPTVAGHSGEDDSDHDGLTNIQELAFGLNPTIPDAASLPQPVIEGGYLTITVTKHPGVAYQVESAATPLGAQPGSFSSATTTVLTNNTTTLKVRDNVLFGTPPGRFLRVQVLAAP